MKVIDLLNKIANGEKTPEKISYRGQWWINKYPNDYEGLGYGGCLLNNVCLNNLNDEIEYEEDKKIEMLPILNENDIYDMVLVANQTRRKINQIIDKINKE